MFDTAKNWIAVGAVLSVMTAFTPAWAQIATPAPESDASQTAAPETAAPQRAKPRRAKPAAAKSATRLVITNTKTTPLTEFEITTTGDNPIVVSKLGKPLPAGQATTLLWKGRHGCVYDIRGTFGDETQTDAQNMDLCKDGKLRLTE